MSTSVARHPWKLPVLSGAFLAFGYFTLGLVVPNLVAFVPLLVWIDANLDRPWRTWRNGGFLFGMALNLLILHWMRSMLRVSFLAVFAYLGLSAVFAVGIAVAVMAMAWMRKRTGWSFVVLLPACWLSLEWFQGQGDLRMTAQHLGQTLGTVPFLVQFADLLGPYGVGLALLLSNALLYEAWRATGGRRLRAVGAWVAMIGAILGYDAWAWTHPPQSSGTMKVAFIQPNVPLFVKMDSATDDDQERLIVALTRKAAAMKADVVIWPETAWPHPLYHRLDQPKTYALPRVQALARNLGVTIVAGAEYIVFPDAGDSNIAYNAAFVVHPNGRIDPTWTAKVYLVPFVEAVPFKFILGPFLSGRRGWMRWLGGGFTPGPDETPLPVAGTLMGVTVCYEELYFDLHRGLRNAGAKIQAVITNDAWFGTTFFQAYQANTVRLRAIENRTSFIRVANTGISMFVDPLGRSTERTELEVEDVRVAELPLAGPPTLYDRIGDVPAWGALLAFGAAALLAWRREP